MKITNGILNCFYTIYCIERLAEDEKYSLSSEYLDTFDICGTSCMVIRYINSNL